MVHEMENIFLPHTAHGALLQSALWQLWQVKEDPTQTKQNKKGTKTVLLLPLHVSLFGVMHHLDSSLIGSDLVLSDQRKISETRSKRLILTARKASE